MRIVDKLVSVMASGLCFIRLEADTEYDRDIELECDSSG